jgi:hypothetical protein
MAYTLIDGVVANDAFATPAPAGTSALVDGVNQQAFSAAQAATAQPIDGVLGLTTWAASGGGPATQTLAPTLAGNTAAFFAPTLAPGAITLAPILYANASTLHLPVVAPGAINLAPGLYNTASTIYLGTVAAGPVALTPTLYSNAQAFYPSIVTAGSVTLSPALFTASNAIYAPAVAPGAVTLLPPLHTNASTVYAPVVTVGDVTLAPALLSNLEAFYPHTVAGTGPQSLSPALMTNAQTFFAPAVVPGTRTLTQVAFNRINLIPNSTMVGGATVGTPGAMPTLWSYTSYPGISRSVVAQGVDAATGFNYVDVRFFGTGVAVGYNGINDLNQTVYCSTNQQVTHSIYAALVAGTQPTSLQIQARAQNQAGTGYNIVATAINGLTADLQRYTASVTLNRADIYKLDGWIQLATNAGTVVDFTLRIAAPQLEYGLTPTAFIPTSGTAVQAPTVNGFFAASVQTFAPLGQDVLPPLVSNEEVFFGGSVEGGELQQPTVGSGGKTIGQPWQWVPFTPVHPRRARKRRHADVLFL